MPILLRSSFGRGWVPDADPVNGPADGLLRMDNLVLDELGVLSLRQGSTKINPAALADPDVHSLFTGQLSGVRYRMAGANNAVYANGSSIITSVAGSGDIAFGSYLGQILIGRSTTKRKYDGTTVRNWGIAMTGGAPTVAAVAADSKVFASCDSGETTWADNEVGAATTQVTGQDGVANGAKEITPDTSGRGTITKTFGSDQDFGTYTSGTIGTDDDLIELYVYLVEPINFERLTVLIDVNASSTNAFQDDYYVTEFLPDQFSAVDLSNREFLSRDYTAEGHQRSRVVATRGYIHPGLDQLRGQAVSRVRDDQPVANAGWSKLSVRRGQMERVGSTTGKDWSTVRAIRFIFHMLDGSADSVVRLDDVKIVAAAMTGRYKYRYIYVRNDGVYVAKSAPSAASAEIILKTQSSTATVPADTSRDTQINEVWVFRMGGDLNAFYRVKQQTGVSGTASIAVTDPLSDRDALIVNIRLETDNTVPPDSIIDIEGPYYDRVFALTSSTLHPSRRRNPDSFATGQAILVSGLDETAYWVKKALGGLYIGTSKDIYRLDGTGAELPDDTIEFTLTPLNIDHPPISEAIAQEGNLLVYLASDGWRVMAGVGSTSLVGATSLLYRGQSRQGVSAINPSGRFRAAITKGQLIALTPEGTSTSYSRILYRHRFEGARWYRHTYPADFRCVFREPDGTLIASDQNGFIWTLDSGTQDDGADIPVVLWTKADDDGAPLAQKDLSNLHLQLDTGGDTAFVGVHKDGNSTAVVNLSTSSTFMDVATLNIFAAGAARQVQLRLTGSLATFRLATVSVLYLVRPIGVLVWDSGPMDLGTRELVWIREIRLKVRAAADLVVTPYFDGAAFTAYTAPVGAAQDRTAVLSIPVGRFYKGFVPRVVVVSTSPFQPYWAEFIRRDSGTVTAKKPIRVSASPLVEQHA